VPDVVAVHEPSPHRQAPVRRRRAELRNTLLTAWLRRPPGTACAETARLAGQAVRDPDARVALAAAARRLADALRQRRKLPEATENEVRLLAAWEDRHD
jgi:hypothetical protein